MMFRKNVQRSERKSENFIKVKELPYLMNYLNYSRDGETTTLDDIVSSLVPHLKELILESYAHGRLFVGIYISVRMGEMCIDFHIDDDRLTEITNKAKEKEVKKCVLDKVMDFFCKKKAVEHEQ